MHTAAVRAAGPQVEKFAPAATRWLGVTIVVIAVLGLVTTLLSDPTVQRTGVFVAAAAILISWVVLIRPVVSVHAHGVLLRNMVSDTFVPSAKIQRCRVLQTLQVVTDTRRFHGLGVSRSARSMMREQRGPRSSLGLSLGGLAPGYDNDTSHRFANEEQTGGTYSEYIESRITRLADDATTDEQEAVVAISWLSVAALVVGAALIVSLFA